MCHAAEIQKKLYFLGFFECHFQKLKLKEIKGGEEGEK